MFFKRVLALARFHIPQFDRFVIASGGNNLAVGRKDHGIDVTTA